VKKKKRKNGLTMNIVSVIAFVEFYFVTTSSVYDTSPFKDVSLTEDSSQIVQARSPTECVLKCRRLTREAFYTDDRKCVCFYGILESNNKENELVLSGNLYNS